MRALWSGTSEGRKAAASEPAQDQGDEVADLMAGQRESVERTKKQRKAPPKRKAS